MADIELVIKIPESQYKTLHAKTQADVVDVIDDKLLIDAIKNGVPLSKGHGKLKDTDALKLSLTRPIFDDYQQEVIWKAIDSATTIIEADNAESEE